MSETRGAVVPLRRGPWDGQEVFVPTLPRMPDSVTFPVQWRDGSWDNAHWHWRYVLRGTAGAHYYESADQPVAVPGLTKKEREEQEEKKLEWLT